MGRRGGGRRYLCTGKAARGCAGRPCPIGVYFEASVRIFSTWPFTPFDRAESTKRVEKPEGRTGLVFGRGPKRINGQTQVRLKSLTTTTLPCADTFLLYSQVERSRSATPVLPPWEPDDPEGQEKESHEALVKDNGRPCYPIELGFDVFDNPG